MKYFKIAVLASAVILTGCGGGGGGGDGTASTPTMPAPVTPPIPPVKPVPVTPPIPPVKPVPAVNPSARALITMFLGASTINVVSHTAVESIVQTATGMNDLYFRSTCVPGANGGGCYTDSDNNLVNVLQRDNFYYRKGVTAFNRRIEGPFKNDPSILVPNPPRDVRTAWREGWTGTGANILIMDDFRAFGLVENPTNLNDPRGVHGYTVVMSANQIAPGATFYGLEAAIGASSDPRFSRVLTTYRQGGLRLASPITNVEITGNIPKIHVVNMSFGSEPINPDITAAELKTAFNKQINNRRYRDVANTADTPLSRALADAVITKSAGNEGADSAFVISNVRLVSTRTPNTRNRTLIVGALDKFARTSTKDENDSVSSSASIADYSNIAGQFVQMQERFLVEYGGSPYSENAYLCNAAITVYCSNIQTVTDNVFAQHGTSYAAPRVAGFAALVRGKFPNLSGEQTAKILLDTATTAGLACHTGSARKSTGCAKRIYGQGHVDIADALSPIGKLR